MRKYSQGYTKYLLYKIIDGTRHYYCGKNKNGNPLWCWNIWCCGSRNDTHFYTSWVRAEKTRRAMCDADVYIADIRDVV